MPNSFVTVDPKNPKGERRLKPGVRLLSAPGSNLEGASYDVREALAQSGFNLPPGGEAIYFASGLLFLRARQEDLDNWRTFVNVDLLPDDDMALRYTLALVEIEAIGGVAELGDLNYSELRQKAETTWRELESLTFIGKSGQRASAASYPAPANAKGAAAGGAKASSASGGHGLRCELEPVVSSDGLTCDVTYRVHWKAKAGEPEAEVESNMTLPAGHPVILQMVAAPVEASAPGKPRRLRALVMTVQVHGGGASARPKK